MAISARIDELKKKFDENPRRYFASLANEYRKAGDLDQALFICQEYLPQQPGHMSGHIVLAQTLYELGRLPEAKTEFEAALALDPENLIALRHLGDIARQSGDPRTARNWYQRVLEADPRNAEIVDVLASLRTTPMASAAAISAVPPTPLSTPVMPPPPAPVAHVPTPIEQAPPVQEEAAEEHELLDLDSIAIGETPLSTPSVKSPAEQPVATDSSMTVEQSAPDLSLDAESFEADAFAIAVPGPSGEAEATPTPAEPPVESATDFNLGLIDDEFTPASLSDVEPTTLEGLRSYEAGTLIKGNETIDKSLDTESYYDVLHGSGRSTPPDSSSAPHETPPSDDDFAPGIVEHFETGLDAEGAAASESVADAFETEETPQVSSTPIEGFEAFEEEDDFADHAFEIPGASPTPERDATPVESFAPPTFETPVSSTTPVSSATPVSSVTPASSAPPVESNEPVVVADDAAARGSTPAASSEIFVTETMADLYLSQGHVDSALDIYRRLLEHRPEDSRLAERIREVESRVSGRTARVTTPEIPAEPVAPRGPTIREFLVSLIASRPSVADFAPPAELDVPSADSPDAVGGTIDALFSSAELSSRNDETSVLAEAFSETSSDDPMLEGQPARPAANELSLDQVFKVATPARTEAQPDGFSFDQFFAGEANSSQASPPNSTPPAEGTDDIAQFNAWLNGLKKT
jgi:tetratricopeptide (TPR) repeat protein